MDNLLDELPIHDERILTLEQTTDSLAVNLFQVQQDVEGFISNFSCVPLKAASKAAFLSHSAIIVSIVHADEEDATPSWGAKRSQASFGKRKDT